jgi:hypothetical protein
MSTRPLCRTRLVDEHTPKSKIVMKERNSASTCLKCTCGQKRNGYLERVDGKDGWVTSLIPWKERNRSRPTTGKGTTLPHFSRACSIGLPHHSYAMTRLYSHTHQQSQVCLTISTRATTGSSDQPYGVSLRNRRQLVLHGGSGSCIPLYLSFLDEGRASSASFTRRPSLYIQ